MICFVLLHTFEQTMAAPTQSKQKLKDAFAGISPDIWGEIFLFVPADQWGQICLVSKDWNDFLKRLLKQGDTLNLIEQVFVSQLDRFFTKICFPPSSWLPLLLRNPQFDPCANPHFVQIPRMAGLYSKTSLCFS